MISHEVRLSDNHAAMLGPVARYFDQDPASLIADNIVDLYGEYRAEQCSRDGRNFAAEYRVDPDYDPGHLDDGNTHSIELPDMVSWFFARKVGNPVPVKGAAINRRISLIAEDILHVYVSIDAVE